MVLRVPPVLGRPLLQVLLHLVHGGLVLDGRADPVLQKVGGDDAVGEIARAAGVEQKAYLGRLLLDNLLELLVAQQVLALEGVGVHLREVLHDPAHKLAGCVPGCVDQHAVQLVGLEAQSLAYGVHQQILLEDQEDLLLFLALPRAVDQAVVDPPAEFFAAVGVADELGLQTEHVEDQLDDHLLHGRQLLAGQKVLPLAHVLAGDGEVLRQGVADQPAGADSQEMVDRVRSSSCSRAGRVFSRKPL